MQCASCHFKHPKIMYSVGQLKKRTKRKCRVCCSAAQDHPGQPGDFDILKRQLCQWLVREGAQLSSVHLEETKTCGRSITTQAIVKPQTTIIAIPRACILLESEAHHAAFATHIPDDLVLSSQTWLALYLLEEKAQPNSFFRPYLNLLPPSYPDMPLHNRLDDMSRWLGPSFGLDMLYMRHLSMVQEYERLPAALKTQVSFSDFQWARTVVITRVFSCETGPNKREEGLVPIADMMNHDLKGCNIDWKFNPQSQFFEMTANQLIRKKAVLLDSYGPKCNSRYLINYGFTLASTQENNQAVLWIPNQPQSAIHSYDDGYGGYNFLVEQNLETKLNSGAWLRFQIPFFTHSLHPSLQALWSCLRRSVYNGPEYQAYRQQRYQEKINLQAFQTPYDFFHYPWVSVAVERQVWTLLAQRVEAALANFEAVDPEAQEGLVRHCYILQESERLVLEKFQALTALLLSSAIETKDDLLTFCRRHPILKFYGHFLNS